MYNYQPSVNPTSYDEQYREAERRVKAKLNFQKHLLSNVTAAAIILAVYVLTSLAAGRLYYFWPVWPLGAMTFGLGVHYVSTFMFPNSETQRRRMIEAELYRVQMSNYQPHATSRDLK